MAPGMIPLHEDSIYEGTEHACKAMKPYALDCLCSAMSHKSGNPSLVPSLQWQFQCPTPERVAQPFAALQLFRLRRRNQMQGLKPERMYACAMSARRRQAC